MRINKCNFFDKKNLVILFHEFETMRRIYWYFIGVLIVLVLFTKIYILNFLENTKFSIYKII